MLSCRLVTFSTRGLILWCVTTSVLVERKTTTCFKISLILVLKINFDSVEGVDGDRNSMHGEKLVLSLKESKGV